MLYNPKWEKKVDIFSLAGLIPWLERQDPTRKYKFFDPSEPCLIQQFLIEHGVDPRRYGDWADVRARIVVAQDLPHTYGAALTRARWLLVREQRREKWLAFWRRVRAALTAK